MFRQMKASSISVSFLLFISYLGLLAFDLKTAGAEFLDEADGIRQNLRQGDIRSENNNNNNSNGDGEIENAETETSRSLIINGKDAEDYPRSMVFLSDRVDDLQCGGTLISPRVVLAAGHCEISLVHEAVFLRYEWGNRDDDEDTSLVRSPNQEIRIKVKEEILHPEYNGGLLRNDVMLVVLEESPNDFIEKEDTPSDIIGKISLPATNTPLVPYMRLHKPDDTSLQDLVDILDTLKKEENQNKEKKNRRKKRNRNARSLQLGSGLSQFSTGTSPSPKTTDLRLMALGWGHTETGGNGVSSKVLQEVTLNWVQNEECKKARESHFLSYEHRITDDMMCTWRSGKDTCQGDSGGPVVIKNPFWELEDNDDNVQFVQVGIISWGEDCADQVFPGVASRVSVAYEWIRDRVCSIDGSKAPAYMNCTDDHTYSPAPSMSPTTRQDALETKLRNQALALVNDAGGSSVVEAFVEAPKVKVCVEIYLDVYSSETSWKLVETDTGITLEYVHYRDYKYENRIKKFYTLTTGYTYDFTIYDSYGDGIQDKGSYMIYIVDESKDDSIGKILVEADGNFKYRREHEFTVPQPVPREETKQEIDAQEQRERNRVGLIRKGIPP